jgi:hypothetical protein
MKRYKKQVVYILVATAMLLHYNIIKADNLVLNPGFEASSAAAKSWTITGPVSTMQPLTAIDNTTRFSGQFGLKMESSNPNCHGRAVQTVAVKGGQTYLFSARFRTEKIMSVHKNVLIRVRWLADKEQVGYRLRQLKPQHMRRSHWNSAGVQERSGGMTSLLRPVLQSLPEM